MRQRIQIMHLTRWVQLFGAYFVLRRKKQAPNIGPKTISKQKTNLKSPTAKSTLNQVSGEQ